MKALWQITNRHRRREAPRLSLFPLLAVLICAMGALVLLLLSVTRQARLQAVGAAAVKNAERQSHIAAEIEMVQWRIDQLKKSRQETEAQLVEARLVLGHVEDHGRRLRDQFRDLARQAKKASDEGLKAGRFVAAGEAELKQIEGRIVVAQQQLDRARQSASNRPKSYAVVPYDGPNHTRRRPIYIECRGDAVVLQPENIVFNEPDFDEPLGPGNPLAAAIRAAREQMLLQSSAQRQDFGEPYPLLLVRPAGIVAYNAALAAMKSWGSEFGYELINQDWQLKYPPPDPVLGRLVQQAVALARLEHARLIAAAPDKYGKRPRSGSYRTPAGEGSGDGGGAGDGDGSGFYSSAKPADRYAHAASGGGSSTNSSGNGGSGGSGGSGFGGGGGNGGNGGNSSGGGNGGSGSGDGPSGDAEFAANNPYAAIPVGGVPGPGLAYGPGNGMSGVPGSGIPGSGIPGGGIPGGGIPGGGIAGGGIAGGGIAGGGVAGGGVAGGGVAGGGVAGGMGSPPGSGVGQGVAGSAVMLPGGTGNGAGFGPANGMGASRTDVAGISPVMLPGGTGNGPGGSPSGGPAGAVPGSPAGVAGSGTAPGNASTAQSAGQPASGSQAAAGAVRPDGYIQGRPNDGNSPPVRPNPSSSLAMEPLEPLRPGEWRPSEPKPDPEQEAKEKKKHPYDKVKLDHDQDDWALRNASRHAAAISRPVRVDCYPDRIVLMPEGSSGEPRVILCEHGGQRDADRLVAAIWEIMDSWGMAGREMYWRPILQFHVVAGAEPRMRDLARSLEGSGLMIERKQ